MDIQCGDRVLVNLAPFIGSMDPTHESVPCEVLELDGSRVQVQTVFPYRELVLWIEDTWIEGELTEQEELIALHD